MLPFRLHLPPLLLLLVILLAPSPAAAMTEIGGDKQHRIHYQSLTALQWNPLGIQSDLWLGYRYRLFSHDNPAFRDNFIGPAFIFRINPAFLRIGAALELQPLTVLTLRAQYEHRAYFGSAGMMQSSPSPASDHSDAEMRRRGLAEQNYNGTGHQFILQAVLRAKVGPIAILNDFAYHHFEMNLWRDDRVFYVSLFDTVAPGSGGVLNNSAHLFWVTDHGWLFGARYTVTEALYSDEDLAAGGLSENPNTPSHRLGPMICYVFQGRGADWKNPTLVFILNWWIKHRYRAGQAVNQAVPYGVLAFQFNGDLWTK